MRILAPLPARPWRRNTPANRQRWDLTENARQGSRVPLSILPNEFARLWPHLDEAKWRQLIEMIALPMACVMTLTDALRTGPIGHLPRAPLRKRRLNAKMSTGSAQCDWKNRPSSNGRRTASPPHVLPLFTHGVP
jgi:hypothetical protein